MTEERLVRANRIAIPVLCGVLVLFTRLFEEGVARAWYYVGGFAASVFFFPVVVGLISARRSELSGWLTLGLGLVFYVGWQAFIVPRWDIPSNFATFLFTGAVFFALRGRDECRKRRFCSWLSKRYCCPSDSLFRRTEFFPCSPP